MKDISIILPYRPDNGYHDKNFKYVYKLLKSHYPDSEMIIGKNECGGTLFNRSNAVNNGVTESSNNILMLYDVDAILPQINVQRSLASLETYPMIFPYDKFWLLSKRVSRKIINGMRYSFSSLPNDRGVTQLVKEGKIGAAVQLVTRDAFDSVGGFNEDFEGWGFEDVYFNFKMIKKYPLGEGIWGKWLDEGDIFHLWHPPAVPNKKNIEKYNKLTGFSIKWYQ